VSLSAFLVIGSTSALTYNVASHLKTVLIMAGGVAFFGDAANASKLGGLALAMGGIVLYSLPR
jgi:solute carrier family 35 protein E3